MKRNASGSKRVCVIHAYPSAYLVNVLHKADCNVVIVGPGTKLTRHPAVEAVLDLPLYDDDRVINAVCEYHRAHPIDVIFPAYEGSTPLTAKVAEALGLPGTGVSTALASRNKYMANSLWRKAGVPAPKTVPITDPTVGWRDIQAHLGIPSVVKLADSMNSQGVIKVTDRESYLAAVDRLKAMLELPVDCDLQTDRNRLAYGHAEVKIIAQEFCPGVEVGIDLLIHGDKHQVYGAFEKAPMPGPFFAESMSVSPSSLGAEEEEKLGTIAVAAARALGLERGAAHVEIRYGHDGPRVIEAGVRSGGAYTTMAIEYLYGVNPYRQLLEVLLGNDIGETRPSGRAALYGGIVYHKSGELTAVYGADILDRAAGVLDYVILNQVGDKVYCLPESAQPHFVYYLLSGDSREEVLEKHRQIQDGIRVEIADFPTMAVAV